MGGIFNIDGPFYRFGSVLWDIMALSLLWILFSLPVFTVGASTAALYYVTTRRVSKKEGYLLRDFWSSFKSNFKQATAVWLLIMAVGVILTVNIIILLSFPETLSLPAPLMYVLFPLQITFLIELLFFNIYVFPIISRFDIKGKTLFKTTMMMMHKHLPTTILLVVMFGVVLLSINYYAVMILIFTPGIYAYGASFFFMRIFKKYRPEMDADDPGELKELSL